MSEDVLTSTSATPWPELAELDGFWDADETPPRGLPRVGAADDVHDADDDPTPVNARRPVLAPTLPPPSTPAVVGPPPVALSEPLGLPTGAPLAPPDPAGVVEECRRPWPRRVGAAALVVGVVVAGVFGWQWNEARHDAASAANILPSDAVAAPDWHLVAFEVDRTVAVSVDADLETGEALAVVSGGLSMVRTKDAFWIREAGVDDWTRVTPTFLIRHAAIVETIEAAGVVTITDIFPAAVHPFLDIVDDRSVDVPEISPSGPTVIDVRDGATIRQLTLRVDRDALGAAEPLVARRLQLTGDGPVDVVVWIDRTGVVWRLSAPPDVTAIGGEYRLVSASDTGPEPLGDVDTSAFDAGSSTSASTEATPDTTPLATTQPAFTQPDGAVTPTTEPLED